MNKELVIVTISYSFDDEVIALVFDSYENACAFIKEEFEREKRIDIEEDCFEIDENNTYFKENMAALSTIYNDEIGTITWTIATVIDKR